MIWFRHSFRIYVNLLHRLKQLFICQLYNAICNGVICYKTSVYRYLAVCHPMVWLNLTKRYCTLLVSIKICVWHALYITIYIRKLLRLRFLSSNIEFVPLYTLAYTLGVRFWPLNTCYLLLAINFNRTPTLRTVIKYLCLL